MFITVADDCARILLSLIDSDHQLYGVGDCSFPLGPNGCSAELVFSCSCFLLVQLANATVARRLGEKGFFWICGLDDGLVSTVLVDPIGGREDGRSSSLYILQSAELVRSCRLDFYVVIAIAKTDSESLRSLCLWSAT